jgi:hypothetical protein
MGRLCYIILVKGNDRDEVLESEKEKKKCARFFCSPLLQQIKILKFLLTKLNTGAIIKE